MHPVFGAGRRMLITHVPTMQLYEVSLLFLSSSENPANILELTAPTSTLLFS